MIKIFSIGHSTLPFYEFVEVLKTYDIESIIDIRRFPKVKRQPQFSKEFLEKNLPKQGVRYIWLGEELGGFRKRGYEEYMETNEFKSGIEKLVMEAHNGKTALMCAEKLFFRCHRRYVADELTRRGFEVIHIIDGKRTYKHKILARPESG
jgi:uncharacterized protein (DUF488 family)